MLTGRGDRGGVGGEAGAEWLAAKGGVAPGPDALLRHGGDYRVARSRHRIRDLSRPGGIWWPLGGGA